MAGKPTPRQIYALAAVLCEMVDERFPATRERASELIERFRRELGHPNPALEDGRKERRRRPVAIGDLAAVGDLVAEPDE